MANTLTGLIPYIYRGLEIVAREPLGAIGAVAMDASAAQAAVNQTIRVPIAGTVSLVANTPAETVPAGGDASDTYVDMSITKSYHYPINYNGEEELSLGSNLQNLKAQQFAQAFRAIAAQVETDILLAAKNASSRAWGTAGTTPFASSLDDAAQIRKILVDNGAPMSDLQLIIDTAAGVKMRGLAGLTAASYAGTDQTLRRGSLLDIFGMTVRESGYVAAHTKGSATGLDMDGNYAIGSTTIGLEGGDSGTIAAGDVVTFGTDTNKYVVNSTTASGAATGNVVLASPGTLVAGTTSTEMTIGNSYRANMAWYRGAVQLLARAPAMPSGGDAASDVMAVTDPVSGLTFQVAMYKLYRKVKIEVGLAWGVKVIKPTFVATLLG